MLYFLCAAPDAEPTNAAVIAATPAAAVSSSATRLRRTFMPPPSSLVRLVRQVYDRTTPIGLRQAALNGSRRPVRACSTSSCVSVGRVDGRRRVARIGVFITRDANPSGREILDQARAADVQGFDSVWLGDHLFDYRGEPYIADGPPDWLTLMPAIGAVTTRIR